MPLRRPAALVVPVTLAAFFASGFAALIYQVIWQRMLAMFSGADVYSATVIVAAFMAGLGLGTLAGGAIADRVSRRRGLLLFAVAELAVGLFGLSSAFVYYDVLYAQLGPLGLGRLTVGLILFGSLLWPTFFMGVSLPLLARAVTDHVERAAVTVGSLYGLNTLGAACGALAATWGLLPGLGLEGSLEVAAAANLACAMAVLPLVGRVSPSQTSGAVAPPRQGPPSRVWPWALAYAFAGFVALSYEIVWFRLLGVMAKASAFTFGTLLGLYLIGLGIGALAGTVLATRVRHADRAFHWLQASACAAGAGLIAVLVGSIEDVQALWGYFGGYEPVDVRASIHELRAGTLPTGFLRIYVLLPLGLVALPTVLMGSAFPVLQRIVHDDAGHVGRRVGLVLLANIAGSLAGTVATGGVALALLGTSGTLRVLSAASAVFVWFATRHRGRAWAATASAAALALTVIVPDGVELWARLHGTTPAHVIVAEDHTGLSVIRAETPDFTGPKTVFVNGLGQSVLPYGDIHTALGALPVLLHPAPAEVAIIGLGSGDTVYAAAGRDETDRIACVEIVGSQLEALQALASRDGYAALRRLLRDPRVEHLTGDGRAFLLRSDRKFDVIEADALRPTSAFSGNLYSESYFRLVRSRLKPGGLAATWAPTRRIHDTFVTVFPYVLSVPGILIGSSEPFDAHDGLIRERLSPGVRAHYARAGVDIEALMREYVAPTPVRFAPDFDRGTLGEINTDLFPRDEFDLSRP